MCVCSVMSNSLRPHRLSPPSSSVYGIFQAEIMEWVPFSSPGYLPDPGIELVSLASLALEGKFFTSNTPLYIIIIFTIGLFQDMIKRIPYQSYKFMIAGSLILG